MSEEDIDCPTILLALETAEEKRLYVMHVLEALMIIYIKHGDKKNVDRSNEAGH